MKLQKRRATWVGLAIVGVVVAVVGGTHAYRVLAARTGEGALRYVPNDALLVVTVDLNPSPSQILTFKRIGDALNRSGVPDPAQKVFSNSLDSSRLAKQISPFIQRSGAFAVLPGIGSVKDKSNPLSQCSYLGLVHLSDSKAVSKILQRGGIAKNYRGLQYFEISPDKLAARVMGDELAIGSEPRVLSEAQSVSTGVAPSILSNANYQFSRSHVAPDANVVMVVMPSIAGFFPKDKTPTEKVYWCACGLSIQNDGLLIDGGFRCDPDGDPETRVVTRIPPLRPDLLKILPTGAYAFFSASGLGPYSEVGEEWIDDGSWKKDLETSLRKTMNIDVKRDIVPAFQGDSVLAAYPDDSGTGSGLDVLAIADDHDGADPAKLANKLHRWFEQQVREDKTEPKGPLFLSTARGAATVYSLSAPYQKAVQTSLRDSLPASMTREKTFTWGTVGSTVLVASSQSLLNRALAGYQHQTNSLSSDVILGVPLAGELRSSQLLAAFSLSRIAHGVEAVMSPPDGHREPKSQRAIFAAFEGLREPLFWRQGTDASGTASGRIFIPMDYAKMIDLVGSELKNGK